MRVKLGFKDCVTSFRASPLTRFEESYLNPSSKDNSLQALTQKKILQNFLNSTNFSHLGTLQVGDELGIRGLKPGLKDRVTL
jgi:hypothetical protein